MNVRIIAGKFGGRILDAPQGRTTHPMGERVRNAMFNSISTQIVGAKVLDAFAGTGAIGFEALSRGAAKVTFVEKNRIAQRVLHKNAVSLRVESDVDVINTTVNNWIETKSEGDFDVIFADPPYHDLQLSTVSRLFALLKPNGLMVLSHSGRGEGPNLGNEIVVVDNRSYGNAYLTYFRREAS